MAERIVFSAEVDHAPPTAMADIVGRLTAELRTFVNTATDAMGCGVISSVRWRRGFSDMPRHRPPLAEGLGNH
jgi:hypothetical protein